MIKLDKTGLDWIRILDQIRLVQFESGWIKLLGWVRVDQIGSDRSKQDPTGSNSMKLEKMESDQIRSDWIGPAGSDSF